MDGKILKFSTKRWLSWRRRRGFGIHSPFAYGLIRYVFGPDKDDRADSFDHFLRRLGINRKTAGRIRRLYRACGCGNTECSNIVCLSGIMTYSEILCVVKNCKYKTECLPDQRDQHIYSSTGSQNKLACYLISSPNGHVRRELCNRLVSNHDGMSIESRDLLILFTNKGLNKQHIRV